MYKPSVVGEPCEAWDRDRRAWFPAVVVEKSILRDVYWVATTYPDGKVLERPRNRGALRAIGSTARPPKWLRKQRDAEHNAPAKAD